MNPSREKLGSRIPFSNKCLPDMLPPSRLHMAQLYHGWQDHLHPFANKILWMLYAVSLRVRNTCGECWKIAARATTGFPCARSIQNLLPQTVHQLSTLSTISMPTPPSIRVTSNPASLELPWADQYWPSGNTLFQNGNLLQSTGHSTATIDRL